MGSLTGRVALITGASRGIGHAIALRFASEGAAIVVNASRVGVHGKLKGTLEGTVEEIQAMGGQATAVVCDLTDPKAREGLVERASEAFGAIDVLVNNAAAGIMKLPSQTTNTDRSRMFELNVNAPVDLAQQAIPGMKQKGTGWILNIGSATSRQPSIPYRDSKEAAWIIGAYGATKAALDRYTQALAHELFEHEIFVNCMAPTSIVLTSGAEYVRDIARKNPDWVEPVETMAEGALELCSGRHVGRVVFSRDILHETARKVRSLDGKRVLGDAFLQADPEAPGA
ncbi:MAG: SDR family NAD(P)-dependent oxidoreductase [Deltaproteobacteria bacterium]|nr:SDR family NAD(P)-dependent oxidoreductase [Deltaproteobacteria bacterium]